VTFDVVGLGQCCIDFLGLVDAYPCPDAKVELVDSVMQGGGPAATAMVAVSRLGLRAAILGRVGDDALGVDVVRGLRHEGVNTDGLVVVPGRTTQLAFIAVERERGTRTVFWTRGTAHPMHPDEVRLDIVCESRLLLLDGLHAIASVRAARAAQGAGIPVLLDAGTMREETRALLPLVTHIAVADGFARDFLGRDDPEAALRALRHPAAQMVCITMGARGCIALDGDEVVHQPAFPVDVVDTTGCGDAFHGGLAYAVLEGWDLRRGLAFASAVAALKCRGLGGRTALPTLAEVEDLLVSAR